MKPDLLESLREQYPPDAMARIDRILVLVSAWAALGFILGAHFICGMPILR